jgi:hypothetical protein
MASINNDIRVRSRSNRLGLVLALAGVALSLALGLSLIPSSAKAAGHHWYPHFSWHGHHSNNQHGSSDATYTQCHNHTDDNQANGIDLRDPACDGVDNTAPVAQNQATSTASATAITITLGATDDDDDLLYFSIVSGPSFGTLSVLSSDPFIQDSLPTVVYTPNASTTGFVDSFVYSVNDGRDADTVTGTVTINVAAPVTPTCGEGKHLVGNECVDNTPSTPECGENQHVVDNACVDNEPTPSTENNTNNNGGNGGGNGGGGPVVSGPLSIGFVNTNNGGQVLGASTELPAGCSAYLTSYLKKGMTGEQVKKLQSFLNAHLGLNLPVNGIFGQLTFEAVVKFQQKYADEILKPWFDKGLSKDMNPSGYAYKMTIYKINLLECSTLAASVPQLP